MDTKSAISIVLKGAAMGAANVIPGVSGGTVAFITGIYERLINALKSFDLEALNLLRKLQIRDFAKHTDLFFLIYLAVGALISVFSLAKLFKWAFAHHEKLVWAFFFGLIAASVPAVGRTVKSWNPKTIISLIIGLAVAVSMAFLGRAEQNDNFVYLMLCGVVGVCSMIIPGLSGSFVLLLMGNYELVMIDAVNWVRTDFGKALPILIPVGIGAVVGLIVLSRFLSWLFKNYHNMAVSLITGFIAGSLAIIWPWKDPVRETFTKADGEVKEKITGFENWRFPDLADPQSWIAIALMIVGAVMVWLMERGASSETNHEENA